MSRPGTSAPWSRAKTPTKARLVLVARPRHPRRARGKFVLRRLIMKRRQHVPDFDLCRPHELWNSEIPHDPSLFLGVDIRHRGIGGTQVDADQESRRRCISRHVAHVGSVCAICFYPQQ